MSQAYSYKIHYIGGDTQLLRTELHPGKMLALLRQKDAFTVHQVKGPRLYIQFANVLFFEDLTNESEKS